MPKIAVISGATSSGKSQLAIDFANKIRDKKESVIINADSLQIYNGLEILSAQPNEEEKKLMTHKIYSILPPEVNSSVSNWLSLVKVEVDKALQQQKQAIIVGGTGMYISALIDGISFVPEIDPKIRELAIEYFDKYGLEKLQNRLVSVGEKKLLDKQRLIRAYEVYLQTGNTLSHFQSQPRISMFDDIDFIHVNLEIDREELYDNCNSRFIKMLDMGVIAEVKKLRTKINNVNYPITKTLGYEQICHYIDGEISKEEMIEITSQKTRNYAKRQLTWFRNKVKKQTVCHSPQEAINYLFNEIF